MNIKRDKSKNILILGAGKPHIGKNPSPLTKITLNHTVINWTINSLKISPQNITLVTGYKAEKFENNFSKFKIIKNPEWKKYGNINSLFKLKFDLNKPLLVVYGDILFRNNIVDLLKDTSHDVTFWDSKSINLKNFNELNINKPFEKIKFNNKNLFEVGSKVSHNC